MTLTPEQYIALCHYKSIWYKFAYDERAAELTSADEKIIEKIYNQWRGTELVVLDCDECVNEAFDRLMIELTNYEKAKFKTD